MIGLLAGGVTQGLKLLGSSKKKPSGKKMASSIVKREPERQQDKPVVTLNKKISTTKFLNLKPLEKDQKKIVEKKSNTGTKIDPIFNRFNDSLSSILSTLITTNSLKRQSEKLKVQNDKKKEAKNRERSLERRPTIGGFSKLRNIPKVPFGDAISNYFKNILIGAIILFIVKQYDKIKKFVTDTFDKVKEIFESLKPVLEPIWNALKWIVGKGVELISPMLKLDQNEVDSNQKKLEDDVNKINEKSDPLEKLFDNIENFAKNIGINLNLGGNKEEKPERISKFADIRGGNNNVDGYGNVKTTGTGYSPSTNVPTRVKQDTEFTEGVSKLAKKYDLPEDFLYSAMGFETGGSFDPAQKNLQGSGATGLIQFMPETARGLGTTTESLSKMSRSEQLTYVDKFLSNKGIKGGTLSDLYMSILFPAAVGKPNNYVLFGKDAVLSDFRGTGPNSAYAQNIGLDLNNDKNITKKEVSKKIIDYHNRRMGGSNNQASISSSSQNNLLASISQQTSYETQSVNIILPPSSSESSQMPGGGQTILPVGGGSSKVAVLNSYNKLTVSSRLYG